MTMPRQGGRISTPWNVDEKAIYVEFADGSAPVYIRRATVSLDTTGDVPRLRIVPVVVPRVVQHPTMAELRRAAFIAEVDDMIELGRSAHEVAASMGKTLAALEIRCRRAGRADLSTFFDSRRGRRGHRRRS